MSKRRMGRRKRSFICIIEILQLRSNQLQYRTRPLDRSGARGLRGQVDPGAGAPLRRPTAVSADHGVRDDASTRRCSSGCWKSERTHLRWTSTLIVRGPQRQKHNSPRCRV